ncbi:hypothetical protein F0L68_25595 [Solihabitans fulvus]|uniref:SWIM zinc finger family protein n=1 Tax=Solihabitans fulvus TaxID=1892852 RepID=A0A5B2X1N2_9PSEU|nr:hypothetical protein [Solihabitans fulvus]KAA2257116.1 hypothetical protein F0L68_25595 [Solihabitans fulvus]
MDAGEQRRSRARAKSGRDRADAVRGGVAGLREWLLDLADGGIAGLPGRDGAWWQAIAARMVDAQARGLASAITELSGLVAAAGPRWAEEAADRIGGLYLLCQLAERAWRTDDELAAVVRGRLGFTVPEAEVLAGDGWRDRWVPLLRVEEDDGPVRTLRQFAVGRERGEWVVVVRHAVGGARPAAALPHGSETDAVLHPYPGATPRRVAVGEVIDSAPPGPVAVPADWRAAMAGLTEVLLADPWRRLHPVGCAGLRLTLGDAPVAVDRAGAALPVRADRAFELTLALTGGRRFDGWGLWDGRTLRLGAVAEPGSGPQVVG